MLIAESGFSFNGKHCRDFGCMWNEDDGRVIVPETLRGEYEIAGRSGTVLLPGETRRCFNYSGVLTMMQEPASEQEAQTRLRTLAAWLSAGRCKLAMDYEPSRYYWAQLDGRQTWTAKEWFAGQLKVKFLCQPWAYAVEETTQAVAGGEQRKHNTGHQPCHRATCTASADCNEHRQHRHHGHQHGRRCAAFRAASCAGAKRNAGL